MHGVFAQWFDVSMLSQIFPLIAFFVNSIALAEHFSYIIVIPTN